MGNRCIDQARYRAARGASALAAVIPAFMAAQEPRRVAAVRPSAERAERSAVPRVPPDSASNRGVIVGNAVVFPYGRSQPVVTCTVLRACIVELEAGEAVVDAPIAGDQVRWLISASRAGPGGTTVLVVVKPQFCDVTTNLIVPTDRRIYDLTLDSPPCRGGSAYNPQQAYVRHVRFSYENAGLPTGTGDAALTTGGGLYASAPAPDTAARETTNRDYRLVRQGRGPFGLFGRRPVDFPWTPAALHDDGAHLTIELPPVARHQAAPALYALEDDGSRTLVNYVVRWNASGNGQYVTDRVARRFVLVLRSGSREQRLELENRGYDRANAGSAGPARSASRSTERRP